MHRRTFTHFNQKGNMHTAHTAIICNLLLIGMPAFGMQEEHKEHELVSLTVSNSSRYAQLSEPSPNIAAFPATDIPAPELTSSPGTRRKDLIKLTLTGLCGMTICGITALAATLIACRVTNSCYPSTPYQPSLYTGLTNTTSRNISDQCWHVNLKTPPDFGDLTIDSKKYCSVNATDDELFKSVQDKWEQFIVTLVSDDCSGDSCTPYSLQKPLSRKLVALKSKLNMQHIGRLNATKPYKQPKHRVKLKNR